MFSVKRYHTPATACARHAREKPPSLTFRIIMVIEAQSTLSLYPQLTNWRRESTKNEPLPARYLVPILPRFRPTLLHHDRRPRTRSCVAGHRVCTKTSRTAVTSTPRQATAPTWPDTPSFPGKRTRHKQRRGPSHIYSVVKDLWYVLRAPEYRMGDINVVKQATSFISACWARTLSC